MPISVDWTSDQGEDKTFLISIPYKGRALPLLGWHLTPGDVTSSQNLLEEILLRRAVTALPETARPIVLGDRGFGRASFLIFLKELEEELRRKVMFVIRLPGKAMVEWEGKRFLLKDFPSERGKVYWLPGALYREDGVIRVNLVLFWDWGMEEPWYLATNFSKPRQAIKWYSRRMQEEEMFRDDKGPLGMREWWRVKNSSRKDRLLFGLMLAYLILAWIGVKAVNKGFVKQVISWGKGSFIFLALEWFEQHSKPPPKLLRLLERG